MDFWPFILCRNRRCIFLDVFSLSFDVFVSYSSKVVQWRLGRASGALGKLFFDWRQSAIANIQVVLQVKFLSIYAGSPLQFAPEWQDLELAQFVRADHRAFRRGICRLVSQSE